MIAIDNILVSDQVIEEQFVCDLNKCKGACCEDGDAGAPLETEELQYLDKFYPVIKEYMTEDGISEIERSGKYVFDNEFGWVTPTLNNAICAYGIKEKSGIIKCAVEQAFIENKIDWKKPISCHLFPIRISKSEDGSTEYVNYEPREDLCAAACKLGKKLKVPAHTFLREAIVRKYGSEFFDTLDATAEYIKSSSSSSQ